MDKIEASSINFFFNCKLEKAGFWFGILSIGILFMGRDVTNKSREDYFNV